MTDTDKGAEPLPPSPLTRRNFIHAIGLAAAGAATSGVPAEAATGGKPVLPEPRSLSGQGYVRKIFNEAQWRTVSVLCDLIIPADDRSGSATQAGVPEFIDDWIHFRQQEDGNDALMALIFGGIMWLDSESHRLFDASFANASLAQQRQILDRIAWPDRVTQEDHRRMLFFSEFRDLTVSGFYSSKMGVADLPYLGNRMVAKWAGCSEDVWQIIEQRRSAGYGGVQLHPPVMKGTS
jgi:gluconate 2-dehydrogenase gamma chain